MIKRKHVLTLMLPLLVVAIAMIEAGCRHTTTTPGQPPPTQAVITAATLLDASNTCVTVQDSLTAANHAIETVQTSDPEYYAKAKPLIQKLSALNTVAAEKVQVAMHTGTGDWKSAMLAVAKSVNASDLNAAGVKNPTSQAIVSASLASLVAILNTINQNFGGAKPISELYFMPWHAHPPGMGWTCSDSGECYLVPTGGAK